MLAVAQHAEARGFGYSEKHRRCSRPNSGFSARIGPDDDNRSEPIAAVQSIAMAEINFLKSYPDHLGAVACHAA